MASEEPRNPMEIACDMAIQVVEAYLAEQDIEVERMFITLTTDRAEGENAVTASGGSELAEDLAERTQQILSMLCAATVAVGATLGITITIAPIGRG